MRIRDWYWQGWERGESGDFRYTGEYYTLPEGRPKAVTTALSGALCVLYLLTAVFPSAGGMWRFAAVPQLLELIPLIYLVIGEVCLLKAGSPMAFRDWYASWRRMRVSAAWSLGVTGAMALVQLAYFFAAEEFDAGPELFYLARILGCAALSFGLYRYMSSHPCSQSLSE